MRSLNSIERALIPLALSGAIAWACNVSERGGDTGGLGGSLGLGGGDGCPRAVAVVLSDYASTQVALVDSMGQTLSESLVSTASSRTDGLAFALSGDVVLPSAELGSGLVVLLDRFGTNVMTFIDPYSGRVQDQLPVGTGFEANPQDYVEALGKGFVARFGQNTDPGRQAFDDGGDLLVLDLSPRRIRGQIVLPVWDDLPARPTALTRIGDEILVSLARISLDFRTTGSAALVGVSAEDEAVTFTHELDYKNCSRPTLSPSGEVFAVVCSGALDPTGQVDAIEESGILLFSASARPLELELELTALELGEGALQPDVAFATDGVVLVKTQTPLDAAANNRLLAVDLDRAEATVLLEASPSDDGSGQGIVYGGLHCPGSCGGACLLADADQGVLQRILVPEEGELRLLEPVRVEERVGLPPIALSPF
jgi:hypothetical protein